MLIKIVNIIINLIDKSYHQIRVVKTLKKININYKTIVDIGFSYGDYSALFLKHLDPIKIIGFEASRKTFNIAKEKFKNTKVEIFNIGISSFKGEKKLNVYEKSSINSFQNININSKYSKIKENFFNIKKNKFELVNINTLDNLCNSLSKIELLKIDVEGHESDVLEGAKKVLDKTKVIMIEIHRSSQYEEYSKEKIYNLLAKHKFVLFSKIRFPLMKWEDRIYIKKEY